MKTSISETFQVKLKPEVLLIGVRFCSEMLNQLSCRIESFLSHTQNEVVNKRRELFKTVKKKREIYRISKDVLSDALCQR